MADGDLCSHNINSKYPINLKQHLQNSHPNKYSVVLDIDIKVLIKKKPKKNEDESKHAISN